MATVLFLHFTSSILSFLLLQGVKAAFSFHRRILHLKEIPCRNECRNMGRHIIFVFYFHFLKEIRRVVVMLNFTFGIFSFLVILRESREKGFCQCAL